MIVIRIQERLPVVRDALSAAVYWYNPPHPRDRRTQALLHWVKVTLPRPPVRGVTSSLSWQPYQHLGSLAPVADLPPGSSCGPASKHYSTVGALSEQMTAVVVAAGRVHPAAALLYCNDKDIKMPPSPMLMLSWWVMGLLSSSADAAGCIQSSMSPCFSSSRRFQHCLHRLPLLQTNPSCGRQSPMSSAPLCPHSNHPWWKLQTPCALFPCPVVYRSHGSIPWSVVPPLCLTRAVVPPLPTPARQQLPSS